LSDALEDLARANKLVSWFCGARALLNHVMRTARCFAILPIPTLALAQGATPAKRPTVGAKPLVQVMPRARYPCTFGSCARQPFAS